MKNEKLVLDVAYQPQERTARSTSSIMLDVIIALIPASVWAVWQFGIQSLFLLVVSVSSCVFFEWGYRKLLHKSSSIGDLSAIVTGLMLAMTLPPTAPAWVAVIGCFFAIVIVKQLYGGIGKNFLNPALAGRAFLMASYATIMSSYAVPRSLKSTVDAISMATPLTYMYGGQEVPEFFTLRSVFLGTMPGTLGEVSALLLTIGGIYLIIRKVISWRIPLSFIGTVALVSLIAGSGTMDRGSWMLYNILCGGVILNGFFMATDYVTSPITARGQIIYGIGCGAITMLIRYFGSFPEGCSYAILIMNLCTWAIDKAFNNRQFGVSKKDVKAAKAAKKAAKEAAK
ncbi:MAG: RnfABCDGE type electron transport complex subunit D [Oscillospiraceae bacterium]|nr:RnfABCDGE type electron transport complex subunit D [Oscillospiraceae bacterium]